MQRHRCARCRNPIRTVAVAGPGPDPDGAGSWFHTDCWEQARTTAQEHYEKQVRDAGLEALIAPYVGLAFAGSSSHVVAPPANGVWSAEASAG